MVLQIFHETTEPFESNCVEFLGWFDLYVYFYIIG